VLAAFAELEKEGWIRTARARGTFVCESLPESRVPLAGRARAAAAFDVPSVRGMGALTATFDAFPHGSLPLLGGLPDVRLVPTAALARAYRRALRNPRCLAYGDPAGAESLREAIASMLGRTRGFGVRAEDVVVTRGSQMALDIVARALLRRGDVVAVEALGYRPAWQALRASGAALAPIPVDREGLVVEALAARAERERIRAVYVTPHHQYPTTAVLGPSRRLALVALARRHRFAILEDDYDHELHYEGRPVLPMASRAPESVVYIGTLSKVLAPGLRLGWVVAPPPLRDALIAIRRCVDRQGDLALEHAVAELFEDGEIPRHVLRMRRAYLGRRNAFIAALEATFGDRLNFDVPRGGMALYAHARGVDVEAWSRVLAERRVYIQTAKHFAFDGRARPYVRLGYGALDVAELERAVAAMEQAWRASG
jgi:GntR family transcriptional regulator/MocR family aminotransferase